MVRAYKEMRKPDAEPRRVQLLCTNCDEWGDIDEDWSEHTVYFHPYHSRYQFVDDDENFIFGDEGEEKTVWEHDSCEEWYVNPEREETGKKDIWVCGNCGHRTYNQDEARRCCS